MREMIDELEEKPVEKSEMGRLDLKGLKGKAKREKRKEILEHTMEGMDKSERTKYLLYFYKETILWTVGIIIVCIISGVALYKATRPVSISYTALNCKDQFEFVEQPIIDYTEAIGKTKKTGYRILGDTHYQILESQYLHEYEGNSASMNYINITTQCTADYFDLIITNMEGAVYCGMQELFYPLDKYLTPEDYELVKDDIIILNDMDGKPQQYALDISDTEFAKGMNLGYTDVYIGFPGDRERNHEVVHELINYLYK